MKSFVLSNAHSCDIEIDWKNLHKFAMLAGAEAGVLNCDDRVQIKFNEFTVRNWIKSCWDTPGESQIYTEFYFGSILQLMWW